MDDLNIKINDDISKDLLNMNLTDMFCKHVIRRNPDGIQTVSYTHLRAHET